MEKYVTDRALFTATSFEGEQVLRAVARLKVTGWFASTNISLAVAEAPLRRSLWLWIGGIVLVAGLTIASRTLRVTVVPRVTATLRRVRGGRVRISGVIRPRGSDS